MAEETEDKRARHRSPGYPTVSLMEAVERVGKLYDADGKAGAPIETALKHIGFAKAHGQAHSVLSALKKFGLVSGGNGRIVPTQRAIEILKLPESDARRAQALKDAVSSPGIYRELIDQYRETGLPGDDSLAAELEVSKGFNPNAVQGFVADFKASLEFAGITDLDALESEAEADDMPEPARIEPETGLKSNIKEAFVRHHSGSIPQISTPVGTDGDTVVFAQVQFNAALKKEYVTTLKKYLDYLETTLQ